MPDSPRTIEDHRVVKSGKVFPTVATFGTSMPGQAFESYDDHRMVMAAAVLGLAVPGIEVPNVATVGKTFPDFTALWSSMVRGESGT